MLLSDLGNIINLVVSDELVGWKRIQNQSLGLDTSPPADDLLVVLQGWFETLAELLWRNKQFIKQVRIVLRIIKLIIIILLIFILFVC